MGTDVYLGWKGKDGEDKKKQITGFSIDDGDVGYMRASIGMTRENGILREIFSSKFWNGKEVEYDFKANYKKITSFGVSYLTGILTEGENLDEMPEHGKKVMGALGLIFSGKDCELKVSTTKDFRYAVMWLNSLYSFFELGIKKQEEGKHPTVYISY